MGTATLIRDHLARFLGHAALYQLDPPLEGHELVAVSSASTFGPETYIFPANDRGEVTNWGELDGSYRGGLDHAEALRRAWYEITRRSWPTNRKSSAGDFRTGYTPPRQHDTGG